MLFYTGKDFDLNTFNFRIQYSQFLPQLLINQLF